MIVAAAETSKDKDQEIGVVRCSSCRRGLGLSKGFRALRNRVYCDEWCLNEPPITDNEVRNDMWSVLYESGFTPVQISRLYGINHATVYRLLDRI